MNNEPWTPQRAAKEALQVQNAGNGTAIALMLHEVGRAFLHLDGWGTTEAMQSAPFKIVLYHLASMSGLNIHECMEYDTYGDLWKECERIAEEGV